MTLAEWITQNTPGTNMHWWGAFKNQMEALTNLVETMGGDARVVSTHTSKSILLPVVQIETNNGRFLLRNNFYDWNLCCLWDFVPKLAYGDLYPSRDWTWYLGVIDKKRNYSYRGWTDEEMEDPRILRVKVPNQDNTNSYWSKVRDGEEKDRWIDRMTDTSWYGRDWSGGKLLVEGEMGPDCTFFIAEKSFAEGISAVVPYNALEPYEAGRDKFILSCNTTEDVLRLMQRIESATPCSTGN